MSSTSGHGFLHGTLARVSDKSNKSHSGSSLNCSHQRPATFMSSNSTRNRIHSHLVSSTYHEDPLNSIHRKLLRGAHQRGSVASKAVLAANPASEVAINFMLEGNSEVQVGVSSPLGSMTNVVIQVTNTERPLVLHWGAIRDREKQWSLPSGRPDGTTIYKKKALRTPFIKTGSNASLTLEIDDPQVETIEFLIFDEVQNKWFKNNGQNFCVTLPKKDKAVTNLPIQQNLSVPEELVQIQAYLRWERKGKQVYLPEKEKEEFEAARRELLQEVTNGTSIEELWARLTNKEDKQEIVTGTSFDKKIPEDLVQIQAYIRWEKAGKPNYSQDEQLREFEEARKELQLELDKSVSIDEIRKKITKGEIQTKVSRKPFIVEGIQRKKLDVTELINKNVMDITVRTVSTTEEATTVLDLWSKAKEEQDGVHFLHKKLFRIGDNKLLVVVTTYANKTKLCAATDMRDPLTLHWALSKRAGEWIAPPPGTLPPGSVLLDKACETQFVKDSEDASNQVQSVEIEVDVGNFVGFPFVLRSNGNWIKNNESDFYVELSSPAEKSRKDPGDGRGTAKALLDRIAELESEAERSFMHRFNIAADLTEWAKDFGCLGLAGILVWMRFMATRQLTWNKNYNVKPREISKAQDRLTDLLQSLYKTFPQYREIVRMIMSTVGRGGEGDVGQRIRDEILVIQRNNNCKGGMMEEWHQKLHNNTSPDDVIICQALIDYIKSDFDINAYWNTLKSNGITKERLLSYDRAIHSEPNFQKDQKEGLLRDLGNYMRTLKAVHSGADLESAIATCMGYKSKGEGFMVGVQINPISGLPSGFPELLRFVLGHVEDKNVEYLLEGLLEARVELRPLLNTSHDRLKDLIFLDIALDSTVRTAIERGYEELNDSGPEKIMYYISLVLENLVLSSDENEDIVYCLKGWHHALHMIRNRNDQWALYAKSVLDRSRLALANKAEQYHHLLQPSAAYLGSLLGVEEWAISIFTEEIIRAGSAASLSSLLNRLDPILRQTAHLGSWQIISPVEVSGYVVVAEELLSVQNKVYERPTVLVAKSVKGEEEIPDGAVAVLTPDMPDVLSHVSVRARNSKICFATCFDPSILVDLQAKEGKLLQLKISSTDVTYCEIRETEGLLHDSSSQKEEESLPSLTLVRKQFAGRYAISAEEFTSEMVGAKSRNIAYLKGKVPSWIGIPTSVAIPFGVFEKILRDDLNKGVSSEINKLKERLGKGDFGILSQIRETVLQLQPPDQLVQELKGKMQNSGMPWPGDEGYERWEQAWLAIKKVWASKWNERAYFSTRKVKLDHDYLCMAVLVQEIINADYAFVIHTANPSSGDSSEIYAEVVKGLGETLVGAYPGRALSFVCKKNNLTSPKVLGYPSKPIALFIRPSLIFRSDSNGEDLEGYAGAGLYDSVPMAEEEEVVVDYSVDPLITDGNFQNSILSSIARAGSEIEELYGSAQDIEGVVKDGKIYVVQTRPQM